MKETIDKYNKLRESCYGATTKKDVVDSNKKDNRKCSINKSFSDCEFHSDNVNGCFGCNHFE